MRCIHRLRQNPIVLAAALVRETQALYTVSQVTSQYGGQKTRSALPDWDYFLAMKAPVFSLPTTV
jgi:hypothetical protein